MIVRNNRSQVYLRGAGKHTKLGELIGVSTKEAVRASAELNGTGVISRLSVMAMLSEYGYDQESLFRLSGSQDMIGFLDLFLEADSDPKLVATVSAVIHLYDEALWGLVEEEVARSAAMRIIGVGIGEPEFSDDILHALAATVARSIASH